MKYVLNNRICTAILMVCIIGGSLYLKHIFLARQKTVLQLPSGPDLTPISADTTQQLVTAKADTLIEKETEVQEAYQGTSIHKSTPRNQSEKKPLVGVVPIQEVVKNLLDQKTSVTNIAQQTGLSKKQIRKIKRMKRQDERQVKRVRKQLRNGV